MNPLDDSPPPALTPYIGTYEMAKHVLARIDNTVNGKARIPVELACEWQKNWPVLWSYVFQETYPEGGYRNTSTILFFLERGFLKVCLNDRENNRSLFRTGDSVDACFDALEEALAGDTADWKAKRFG